MGLGIVATGFSLRANVVTGAVAGVLVTMYLVHLSEGSTPVVPGSATSRVFKYYGNAIEDGIEPFAFAGRHRGGGHPCRGRCPALRASDLSAQAAEVDRVSTATWILSSASGGATTIYQPREMGWSLAFIALALLGVAAVSKRLAGTPVTPAMLFVAIGLLVGPEVLDAVDPSDTGSTVRGLAEATLALVLFADASRIDLGELRREAGVPVRLLAIGLPLTIAAGAVAGAAVFGELSLEEALILAVVLAPTDAALGQAVVVHPRVPQRIRQGLNVESGLNDGICVPLLFAAVALADVESDISGGRSAGTLLVEEIGFGVLGGVAAGLLTAAIVVQAGRRDLIAGVWRQVIPAAGAGLAYGVASALDGSGFIAAFVAGVVFRLALGRDPEKLNRLTEEVGDVLSGVTFVLFGAVLLGPALEELSWELVLYAVLSLTLVRLIPVAIAMLGSGARAATVAFLGWFGPRGLASIVFAVMVIEESELPHERLIVLTIYLTVGLSVLAHGLSAAPLADRYARWYEQHPSETHTPMESAPSHVTRARGPAEPRGEGLHPPET